MAYIGKSPTGTGVRSRYYFTATAGATSLSGADDNSNTLVFSDGNYVDVSLNGIALVAGTDYNTSTANTISGLSALSSGDIVEVVVYDIFTVADTVSAKDGGTFSGNVAMGGTLSVTGASTLTGDLTVDTNTLYVDSTNNRVGVGTTSPDVVNHIVGVNGKTTLASHDAQTVAVVENNSDAQFAIVANSANSSQLFFGDESNELVGRIRYNHSTNNMGFYTNTAEYFRITGGGVVEVLGSTDTYNIQFARSGPSRYIVHDIDPANGPGYTYQIFREGGTQRGSISLTSGGVAYNTSSDYRLKENVVADWDATTRLKQLNPVRFNFTDYPNTTVDGFLAHEVQTVVPEAVTGTHDEVDDDGNPVYQGIDQSKLVPLLVKTIQELEARIVALENA